MLVKWLGKRKETFIESRGFSGVRKQERETPEFSSTVSEDVGDVLNVTAQLPNNDSHVSESASDFGEISKPTSGLRKKLSQHGAQECAESEGIAIRSSQYRLGDIGQLSSALSDIHRCEQGRPCDLLLLVIEFISNHYRFLSAKCR